MDRFLSVKNLIPVLLAIIISQDLSAVERRRDQYLDEQGYYIFPTPYSLPGIGSGVALVGAMSNIANSYTDFYGYLLTGDIEGVGIALSEVHIVPKRLLFDFTASKFRSLFVQNYSFRGIGGDKDDFTFLELDDNEFFGARFTGTFFNRMLEIYTMGYDGEWHISALRDKNGEVIQSLQDSESISYGVAVAGMRIDYTDDYQNPRTGVRFDVNATKSLEREEHSPSQYTMQYNLSGYFPFRKWDTLVFNYFHADAVIQSQGETDRSEIERIYSFDCTEGTVEQQNDCNELVANIIAGNRYGTAGGLGGTSRLRAYPQSRFIGAHVRFLGIEYRWNVTEESTPFDIWVAKDIRTSLQLAFFYEVGSVADLSGDLFDEYRSNFGFGARMVTESGFVLRGDLATGDEGLGITVIIGYPWESF